MNRNWLIGIVVVGALTLGALWYAKHDDCCGGCKCGCANCGPACANSCCCENCTCCKK